MSNGNVGETFNCVFDDDGVGAFSVAAAIFVGSGVEHFALDTRLELGATAGTGLQ